jgi:hypothetical protein
MDGPCASIMIPLLLCLHLAALLFRIHLGG